MSEPASEPSAAHAAAPNPFTELSARLARYPADRYPVQHAATSFQLGSALIDAGRFPEAERALAVAAGLFTPDRMPGEHATALNARGAALRADGRPGEAAACFREAAEVFAGLGLELERGAALFNLGLVRRETGDDPRDAFREARTLLDAERVPGQASAAARELGSTLLTAGAAGEAVAVLTDAVALAGRAGDLPALGAAANVLGLALLDSGDVAGAVTAFRDAAGAHPRSVRPDGYAMAKANLALACERAGDAVRGRLAARQALGVPAVPDAVVRTAAGVLHRLGPGAGGLLDVLDMEPEAAWPALVREDLQRWADAWPEDGTAEAGDLVAGVLARRERAAELVAVWLGGLLELPPPAAERIVRDLLRALQERVPDEAERIRSLVARGCARFHVPQMERLTRLFEDLAARHGGAVSWR